MEVTNRLTTIEGNHQGKVATFAVSYKLDSNSQLVSANANITNAEGGNIGNVTYHPNKSLNVSLWNTPDTDTLRDIADLIDEIVLENAANAEADNPEE